jgi:flagellar biosynthesis protein FlhF
MRLKSFHGATLTDAMRQVRAALGEDAIIVATRDDDLGGIRVTAAIDDAPPPPASPMAIEPDADIIGQIADALHYHGVHAALAEKLLMTATHFAEEDAVLALAAACEAHLQFRPLNPDSPYRPILLAGPPGAGKTLTIAKLATAAKLKNRPVTVITSDLVRAGGVEQLAAFTSLLKIPLLEIEQPEAVIDMLAELAGKQLVLVDTAGCNPYDAADRAAFSRLVGGRTLCDMSLVLPGGYDSTEGTELARAFSSLGVDRLLITRVDLIRRFGTMLNIAQASGLALANLSQSANVTAPLQALNPVLLARCLLQPAALLQEAAPPSVAPLAPIFPAVARHHV